MCALAFRAFRNTPACGIRSYTRLSFQVRCSVLECLVDVQCQPSGFYGWCRWCPGFQDTNAAITGSDQANRRISTGQLSTLLRLHLRPIDVVVFHGPHARPCFEGGFPLRCLQRLSFPDIATLHCCWRNNRSTSGASTPVLSY